jgi:hypothetical protein
MELFAAAQRHPRATALYISFALGCVAVWKFLQFRNAAMDHILTLSASLQSLAFALLVVEAGGGCGEGLSEKGLWAFFIAHVSRLSTTLWGPGYTPEDNTSDVFLYQILELVGVIILGYYLLKLGSMRSMRDVGQGYEKWSVLGGMVGVSLVVAFFTKSTGHNDWFADLSWMFSVWLEALALGPQVMLLCMSSQVEDGAMHFVAVSLLASLAFGYFWTKKCVGPILGFSERWLSCLLLGCSLRSDNPFCALCNFPLPVHAQEGWKRRIRIQWRR